MKLNATRHEILKTIKNILNSNVENVLNCFVGHGVNDELGGAYWIPIEATEEVDDPNWIHTDRIIRMAQKSNVKRIIIVLDSRFSGKIFNTRGATKSAAPASYKGKTNWIKKNKKIVRVAFTSGGNEPIWDGGGDGCSVFAREFINQLENNTSIVLAKEIAQKIGERLAAKADQEPLYSPKF